MGVIILYGFFCALLLFSLFKKHWGKPQQRGNLPPGSMGWSYIGETLQLYSQNPDVFFATRQKRFGEIFKTYILGYPCVMLASPEAIRFVLVTKADLFKPTYPRSKEQLIGPSAIFFHQGAYHSQMRKLVQGSFSLKIIRNLVPEIEAIAISTLESWCGGKIVNTFYELKKFTFDVAVLSIFGDLDSPIKEKLRKNYCILDKGYNSFPLSLPGTSYNTSVLARKRIGQILFEIIRVRKEKNSVQNDFLGSLLNFKDEKGEILRDDQILDNIIGVLFAAQDTTASILTWILKYIHDDPKLLEAIKKEQKPFFEANDGGNLPLTWAQTRNMPLTNGVIMESLRMASIISFTFREAVTDVEYNGWTKIQYIHAIWDWSSCMSWK